MRDKIIRIYWHEPVTLKEAIKSDLSNMQGLYYITRVFGRKETSLYLGIARYNNTIRHRLKGHRNSWLTFYRGRKMVRIGEIVYPNRIDNDAMADVIYDAESALLYAPEHHRLFPENIGKRKSYSYNDLYRIENTGDIYELAPIIRMHDQGEYSLIKRWMSDPNPVRISGKSTKFGEDVIKIREVDSIEKAFKGK